MAANVAGGAIQAAAASRANRSMFNTFQDEINRQNMYGAQEWRDWSQALPLAGSEEANRQLDLGTQQRIAGYDAAQGSPLMAAGHQPGLNTAADSVRLGLENHARAKMGAYGDWTLNQQINKIKTQQALNYISQKAQGDAAVFPFQMYQAQHSMDELAALGAMISSIGGGSSPMQSSQPPMQGGQTITGFNQQTPYGVGYGDSPQVPAADGGGIGFW